MSAPSGNGNGNGVWSSNVLLWLAGIGALAVVLLTLGIDRHSNSNSSGVIPTATDEMGISQTTIFGGLAEPLPELTPMEFRQWNRLAESEYHQVPKLNTTT